jgi:hypothetical protein
MLKTLAWKETRELAPLVALALAAQGLLVFLGHGFALLGMVDISNDSIPFVDHSQSNLMLYVGGIAAIAVGLWQTVWESGRGTFLFLLHRPIERPWAFGIKLITGTILVLAIPGLPLLIYALWAATPGTHASPFYWSMTTWAWLVWFRLPLVYLGAFLSGLRPARWTGTRAAPIAASILLVLILLVLDRWPLVSLAATLALEGWFLLMIFQVAATRDYS